MIFERARRKSCQQLCLLTPTEFPTVVREKRIERLSDCAQLLRANNLFRYATGPIDNACRLI